MQPSRAGDLTVDAKTQPSSKMLTYFILRKWNQLVSVELSTRGTFFHAPQSADLPKLKTSEETKNSPTLTAKDVMNIQETQEGFNTALLSLMVKKKAGFFPTLVTTAFLQIVPPKWYQDFSNTCVTCTCTHTGSVSQESMSHWRWPCTCSCESRHRLTGAARSGPSTCPAGK